MCSRSRSGECVCVCGKIRRLVPAREGARTPARRTKKASRIRRAHVRPGSPIQRTRGGFPRKLDVDSPHGGCASCRDPCGSAPHIKFIRVRINPNSSVVGSPEGRGPIRAHGWGLTRVVPSRTPFLVKEVRRDAPPRGSPLRRIGRVLVLHPLPDIRPRPPSRRPKGRRGIRLRGGALITSRPCSDVFTLLSHNCDIYNP